MEGSSGDDLFQPPTCRANLDWSFRAWTGKLCIFSAAVYSSKIPLSNPVCWASHCMPCAPAPRPLWWLSSWLKPVCQCLFLCQGTQTRTQCSRYDLTSAIREDIPWCYTLAFVFNFCLPRIPYPFLQSCSLASCSPACNGERCHSVHSAGLCIWPPWTSQIFHQLTSQNFLCGFFK